MKRKLAVLMCMSIVGTTVLGGCSPAEMFSAKPKTAEELLKKYQKGKHDNFHLDGNIDIGVDVSAMGVSSNVKMPIEIDMDYAAKKAHGDVNMNMSVSGQSTNIGIEMYADGTDKDVVVYAKPSTTNEWVKTDTDSYNISQMAENMLEDSDFSKADFEYDKDKGTYTVSMKFEDIDHFEDYLKGSMSSTGESELTSQIQDGLYEEIGKSDLVYVFDSKTLDLLSATMDPVDYSTTVTQDGISMDMGVSFEMDMSYSKFGKIDEEDVTVPDKVTKKAVEGDSEDLIGDLSSGTGSLVDDDVVASEISQIEDLPVVSEAGENDETDGTGTDTIIESKPQETTTPVVSGSGKYVDFDDMHFYVNGKKYTLGKTTLQEMIDDGVPFEKNDLANAGNNLNPSTQSSGFKINLAEYCNAQVSVFNETDENKKASECYINEIYLPTSQEDGQKILTFDFPTSVTEEEMKANAGTPTKEDQYDGDNGYVSRTIEYTKESTKYYHDYGYDFEFINGELQYITIDYMP